MNKNLFSRNFIYLKLRRFILNINLVFLTILLNIFLIIFLLDNNFFAEVGKEIQIKEYQVDIPVYRNKNGNYIIKTEDLMKNSEQYDSVDIVADKDKNGELTIDKSLLDSQANKQISTITINCQTTADLKNYRIRHNYVNYQDNMKYILEEKTQNLPDQNLDGTRNVSDIDIDKYKNNIYKNQIYNYGYYETSFDNDKELFLIDIVYTLGEKDNITDIDNMPSKIVNTGIDSNNILIISTLLIIFASGLLIDSKLKILKEKLDTDA